MAIVITTALALGVGALAACLVPWFYCKSGNDAEDDREATATDSVSQSRSIAEGNASSSIGSCTVCVRGFNFVRVVVPKTPVNLNTSGSLANGESAIENPVNGFSRDNPTIVKTKLSIQGSQITNKHESGMSWVSKEAQKIRFSDNPKSTELDKNYVQSGITNSVNSNNRSVNSKTFDPTSVNSGSSISTLSPISEENLTLSDSSSSEALNLTTTDETSTRTTNKTLSSEETQQSIISRENGLRRTATVTTSGSSCNTDEWTTETTNGTWKSRETDSSANTRENSNGSLENMTLSRACGNMEELSRERLKRTSTFRDLETFIRPTGIGKLPIMEFSKITELLDTIDETSVMETSTEPVSAEMKSEASDNRKNSWIDSSIKSIPTRNSSLDVDSSIKSLSLKNLNRSMSRLNVTEPRNSRHVETSDSAKCSSAKNHKEQEKRSSERVRYTLSDRIKRIWRGMKFDKTPQTPRTINDESRMESVRSLSLGPKVPAGNSTMINVETTLSSIYRQNLFGHYDDPRIGSINSYNHKSPEWRSSIDEEPLDLSTRFNLDLHDNNNNASNVEEKNENSSGQNSERSEKRPAAKKEFYREVVDFLRSKRVSDSREEGATRSNSIKFYQNPLNSLARDERKNIASNCSANTVEKEKKSPSVKYRVDDRTGHDNSVNVQCESMSDNEIGLTDKFKKIFNFRSRNVEKSSSSGKSEPNFQTVPIEYHQRDSMGTTLRSRKNGGSECSSVSELHDISSYVELGFILSADEKYIGPCTRL